MGNYNLRRFFLGLILVLSPFSCWAGSDTGSTSATVSINIKIIIPKQIKISNAEVKSNEQISYTENKDGSLTVSSP